MHYAHVATWVGALQFALVTKDEDLRQRLVARFDPFLPRRCAARAAHRSRRRGGVRRSCRSSCTCRSGTYRYRVMGLAFADAQWDNPTPDGLTVQTRWWIDDMYMITALQLQAYRATGDAKYLERAAREMVAYLDKLQEPNGLFFHAPDVKHSTGAAATAGWPWA